MKPDPLEPGTADTQALGAMSRVLAAEREAEAQIAACERRCQEHLDEARAARRALLERVQQRIVELHERAAQGREERSRAILAKSRATAPSPTAAPAPERMQEALARLVTQLLSSDKPQ